MPFKQHVLFPFIIDLWKEGGANNMWTSCDSPVGLELLPGRTPTPVAGHVIE